MVSASCGYENRDLLRYVRCWRRGRGTEAGVASPRNAARDGRVWLGEASLGGAPESLPHLGESWLCCFQYDTPSNSCKVRAAPPPIRCEKASIYHYDPRTTAKAAHTAELGALGVRDAASVPGRPPKTPKRNSITCQPIKLRRSLKDSFALGTKIYRSQKKSQK